VKTSNLTECQWTHTEIFASWIRFIGKLHRALEWASEHGKPRLHKTHVECGQTFIAGTVMGKANLMSAQPKATAAVPLRPGHVDIED
jgi:hypothetical protein